MCVRECGFSIPRHSLEQFSTESWWLRTCLPKKSLIVSHTFKHQSAATFLRDRYIGCQTGASYSKPVWSVLILPELETVVGHPKDVKSLRYRIINYSFITSLPSYPDATPVRMCVRRVSSDFFLFLVEWVQFSWAAQPFKLVIEVCWEIVWSQLEACAPNTLIIISEDSRVFRREEKVTVAFHLSYVCLCCVSLTI